MNSNQETGLTLPPATTSNDSSRSHDSCFPRSWLEEPNQRLTLKPKHLMTEEELRAEVQAVRARRQSTQTFKAHQAKEAEEELSREPRKPKVKQPSEVDAFFSSLGTEEKKAEVEDFFKSL